MFKVLLDTLDGDDKKFVAYLKKHNIQSTQVAEVGLAGGCPVVEYVSESVKVLQDMIMKFWDDDFLFEMIDRVRLDPK